MVLTGAGISTDSGIPDFRGPNGVWTRNPDAEKAAHLSHYLSDRDVRVASWRNRLAWSWDARPNPGHAAVSAFDATGRLGAVATQNIDGLHQAAGLPAERVIEVHGSIRETVCWSCGDRRPMAETLERVRAGEEDPECLAGGPTGRCGGILKSATISFGQSLDPEVLMRAEHEARSCDVMVAVGSSLTVHPAAGLVPLARRTGAALVIVNAEDTPYDGIADVVVRTPISQSLPVILADT